ncbi:cation-translocating P-type ATPase [Aliiglaciecola sp. LCG003]|uniref:cation-translocating P-type ATPase n=1 Tax=Aliiglaciecola sp. LCG003 TaxID=3053655 RepID=UPI0025724BCB|nr:cation-translocating P-type ATPase [Aliiglaciecola sp. LCG003]WJG07680.1 cation-translocating P-type ATPase [Aliiglaciecola sp. LCG003]
MEQAQWHKLSAEEVFESLSSSQAGLTTEEASSRIAQFGKNALPDSQQKSIWLLFFQQFTDLMIVILLCAAIISGVIGELIDSIVIMIILALNAMMGTFQEYRAQQALSALKHLAAPNANIWRDGKLCSVSSELLVPGDVVHLEQGNIVPADLRVVSVEGLKVDESSLTGESIPVDKQIDALTAATVSLGDKSNLVFKNTNVVKGKCLAVVVETGINTEVGKIANLLQNKQETKTPLQIRLMRFSRYLAAAVLIICLIVLVAGVLQGQPLLLMFLTAVSLAVAAIPEALPAVITISLALGARNLFKQHALVRNLPAVETLGSVTYICTDKTGTLTQNKMSVSTLYTENTFFEQLPQTSVELGQALALCNNVIYQQQKGFGEATELALFELALKSGFDKKLLEETMPRTAAIEFDSKRKLMTTLHPSSSGYVAYVKGAPERVIERCVDAHTNELPSPFCVQSLLEQVDNLSAQGLRVLAIAKRDFSQLPDSITTESVETDLQFLGLVGLIDPLRPEVPQAVKDCVSAGIIPVMITGDHQGTALAIARQLNIAQQQSEILSGEQLAQLSQQQLIDKVTEIRLYSRVSPEQKLNIVAALQQNHQFVAMTGDGVNDAPALQRADIGIAMGKKGTDVARGASDMVLLDDDFSTIVRSVQAGRRIFDNIRKFIKYTMSSNSGEIWTLFLAPLLGLPIPLLPIHILWINLVTDGLPGLAFSAEKAERNIMQRPPRPVQENIFAHGMWQHILWVGLLVGGLCITVLAWDISAGNSYWQTSVFTVLVFAQLFHSIGVRSEIDSIFSIGLMSNKPMVYAVSITVLLQLAVIYIPSLNDIFHTQPLPIETLLICVLVSSVVLWAVEIEKYLIRKFDIYNNS